MLDVDDLEEGITNYVLEAISGQNLLDEDGELPPQTRKTIARVLVRLARAFLSASEEG